MVYVNQNGEVGEKRFSIVELFWKMIYFFVFFFRSLLGPLLGDSVQYDPDSQARFRSSLRGNGGGTGRGAGGGGGGLWPGRPGGGGGGGRPRFGRLNTFGPSSMPSCPSGGCCR